MNDATRVTELIVGEPTGDGYRIVTLPRSAIEAVRRAQDAVAEAGQQTLDNWDTIMTDPKSD